MIPAALAIEDLHAWYGESHVLHGMAVSVAEGEVVALLGRNGAGKTTTMRAIMGLVRRQGSVRWHGEEMIRHRPDQIARAGVGYVPEERAIFAALSVRENLMLPPAGSGGMAAPEVTKLFPNLNARAHNTRGAKLSGGEQQMLALTRVLRTGARLLLLDEPTEGLAPVIVRQIGQALAALKLQGYTMLLVEQNPRFVAMIADRHYVVERGRVIDMVTRADFAANKAKLHAYLGV